MMDNGAYAESISSTLSYVLFLVVICLNMKKSFAKSFDPFRVMLKRPLSLTRT